MSLWFLLFETCRIIDNGADSYKFTTVKGEFYSPLSRALLGALSSVVTTRSFGPKTYRPKVPVASSFSCFNFPVSSLRTPVIVLPSLPSLLSPVILLFCMFEAHVKHTPFVTYGELLGTPKGTECRVLFLMQLLLLEPCSFSPPLILRWISSKIF